MFCKTCGTLLQLQKTSYGKWMKCPRGHPQPELNQEVQILKEKNIFLSKGIKILDGKNILAVYEHICKKCGYDKAELLETSCNYTDEDNIYKMKCGKCGFVEQLEGKVK